MDKYMQEIYHFHGQSMTEFQNIFTKLFYWKKSTYKVIEILEFKLMFVIP